MLLNFKRGAMILSLVIITGAIAFLIFYLNAEPDLKLKLYKTCYVNYMRICKNRLDARFSNAVLKRAIINAEQQPWVQQQIAADLAPFSAGFTNQQVAQWFQEFLDYFNCLVKIKVARGMVTVETAKDFKRPVAYKTVIETIEVLARKRLIPDCEFIVALSDYVAVVPMGHTTPVPIFTFAKHLEIPVEKDLILIPDWMNLHYLDMLRGRIKLANKTYPWDRKLDLIHWRGGGSADSMQHRAKLVQLSYYYDFIDAGMIDGILQVRRVDPEFSIKNKYQISLDGARSTWERVVWQMHANSVMLKPNSPQVQWFYRGLKPYENYVPLADIDAENVVAAYKWLQDNDALAQQISSNANKFAQQNLKTEDFMAYYVLLLREYSKLLR